MCCSVSPAVFTNTRLYAAEAMRDGNIVHVLGYQNQARNHHDGPNAMILPFPAKPGTMSKGNVVETTDFPKILEDMERAITPPPEMTRGFSYGLIGSLSIPPVEIFEYGIYTVVLAQNALDIPGALDDVPEEKRPALNSALFEAYARWYPDWPIALCCFNNRDAQLATPMLWWYEPTNAEHLFLPALDAHDGNAPDLNTTVMVDHAVMASANVMLRGETVEYTDEIPDSVEPLLPKKVLGRQYHMPMENGDFSIPLSKLRAGTFVAERMSPPGS